MSGAERNGWPGGSLFIEMMLIDKAVVLALGHYNRTGKGVRG